MVILWNYSQRGSRNQMNPGNGTETKLLSVTLLILLGRNQMNPGNGTETQLD